jgi:hypothetical protein
MLPLLYRWPLRDDNLITAIGPKPSKPIDFDEDEVPQLAHIRVP